MPAMTYDPQYSGNLHLGYDHDDTSLATPMGGMLEYKSMKAVVTVGDGTSVLKDVPIPKPGPRDILVKAIAVAQNPTEAMVLNASKEADVVIGCDYAGVVVEIGSEVPEDTRKIGERVTGFVFGGHPPAGAFAEYVVADAEVVVSIPDDVSFEDAASIGLAGFTACQMLYQVLGLNTPLNPISTPTPILIWSGASAVGGFAIQLARASGYTVITTASPHNHEYVKSLGADVIFNYREADVGSKIRDFTGGKLTQAVDCIASGDTPTKVSESLSPAGGKVAIVLPYKSARDELEAKFALVYTLLGKAMTKPYVYPAMPEHYQAGKEYAAILEQLLRSGKLKTTPLKIMPKGLASVSEGIEYQKAGKVSAQKITYRIEDTS